MDIKIPTLAERKAARRAQVSAPVANSKGSDPSETPAQTSTLANSSLPKETQTTPSESHLPPSPASPVLPSSSWQDKVASPVPVEVWGGMPSRLDSDKSDPPVVPGIGKEELLAIAKSMGLELAAPKRIWIKHSFSITPESKETFQERCRALGLKMQDAMEEAMNDWFRKTEASYRGVQDVRKNQNEI